MRLCALCLCLAILPGLRAADAIESDVLWGGFSEIVVEDTGLKVTLNPAGLGMAVVTEGETPEAVTAGTKVLVPYRKETVFANRSVSVMFTPVVDSTNFEIRRSIDHRSAGGELETLDELLDVEGALKGTSFEIVAVGREGSNAAVKSLESANLDEADGLTIFSFEEEPTGPQQTTSQLEVKSHGLMVALTAALAILWLIVRLLVRKK